MRLRLSSVLDCGVKNALEPFNDRRCGGVFDDAAIIIAILDGTGEFDITVLEFRSEFGSGSVADDPHVLNKCRTEPCLGISPGINLGRCPAVTSGTMTVFFPIELRRTVA